mmetsp:Transcript_107826/g.304857  ORF Transcript_107826/g.304857 Transcript_107826/m.304857 type:complete len:459 (-) Transcript_107826:66-1442(-)
MGACPAVEAAGPAEVLAGRLGARRVQRLGLLPVHLRDLQIPSSWLHGPVSARMPHPAAVLLGGEEARRLSAPAQAVAVGLGRCGRVAEQGAANTDFPVHAAHDLVQEAAEGRHRLLGGGLQLLPADRHCLVQEIVEDSLGPLCSFRRSLQRGARNGLDLRLGLPREPLDLAVQEPGGLLAVGHGLAADGPRRLDRDLAGGPRGRQGRLRGRSHLAAHNFRRLPAGLNGATAGLVPHLEEAGEPVHPGWHRPHAKSVAEVRGEEAAIAADDLVVRPPPLLAHLRDHRREVGAAQRGLPEEDAAAVPVLRRRPRRYAAHTAAAVGPLAAGDLHAGVECAAHGHALRREGQDLVGPLEALVQVVYVQDHHARGDLGVLDDLPRGVQEHQVRLGVALVGRRWIPDGLEHGLPAADPERVDLLRRQRVAGRAARGRRRGGAGARVELQRPLRQEAALRRRRLA